MWNVLSKFHIWQLTNEISNVLWVVIKIHILKSIIGTLTASTIDNLIQCTFHVNE